MSLDGRPLHVRVKALGWLEANVLTAWPSLAELEPMEAARQALSAYRGEPSAK